MSRTPIVIAALFALTLGGSALFASGSSGGGVPSSTNAQSITENYKCVITAVNQDGSVTMRDLKTEQLSRLMLAADAKIVAQDKAAFDGRKKLDRGDLAEGQTVRVTVNKATNQATRIKVLKAEA